MPDAPGPWHRDPPPPSYNPSLRLAVLVALIVVLALGLWRLSLLFPGRADSDFDTAQFINLAAFGVLVASGLIFARRVTVRETVRNLSLWTGIAAVLVLGYSYQDEIA